MKQDFINEAVSTENKDFDGMADRLSSERMLRLLHAGIGLSTEAGEFLDAIKKHVFYGKDLDKVNIEEELGDSLYYIAIAIDALELNPLSPERKVIKKLRTRYPNKFTKQDAINRDLDHERTILESNE